MRMATMSFQWWERRYVHIMSVYSEFVSASALIVHCNAFSWLLDIVDPQPAAPPDRFACFA